MFGEYAAILELRSVLVNDQIIGSTVNWGSCSNYPSPSSPFTTLLFSFVYFVPRILVIMPHRNGSLATAESKFPPFPRAHVVVVAFSVPAEEDIKFRIASIVDTKPRRVAKGSNVASSKKRHGPHPLCLLGAPCDLLPGSHVTRLI